MKYCVDNSAEEYFYDDVPANYRNFLCAILERALVDLDAKQRHIKRKALTWFSNNSRLPEEDGFLFRDVIAYLNFNQHALDLISQRIENAQNGKKKEIKEQKIPYWQTLTRSRQKNRIERSELAEGIRMRIRLPFIPILG